MNKITTQYMLYTLSLLIIVAGSVLAEDTFIRQNMQVNITHSVRVQGAPTSAANCNITLFDPRGNLLIPFRTMTYNTNSQTFNYTIPESNTSQTGIYSYDITCMASGLNNTETFTFEVNPTGKQNTTGQSVIYFLVLTVLVCMFCFFCYGAAIIPYSNERTYDGELVRINWRKYLKVFCIMMSYSLFMAILYTTWNLTAGYLAFTALAGYLEYTYYVMIKTLIPLAVVIFFVSLTTLLYDAKLYDKIRREIPDIQ